MELIAVSGPAPEDTQSPEYLKWHEAEFNARGGLVIRQSSQITALQAHVSALENQLTGVIDTCRGLVKPPEPPKPLELVEDVHDGPLPEPDPDPEPSKQSVRVESP